MNGPVSGRLFAAKPSTAPSAVASCWCRCTHKHTRMRTHTRTHASTHARAHTQANTRKQTHKQTRTRTHHAHTRPHESPGIGLLSQGGLGRELCRSLHTVPNCCTQCSHEQSTPAAYQSRKQAWTSEQQHQRLRHSLPSSEPFGPPTAQRTKPVHMRPSPSLAGYVLPHSLQCLRCRGCCHCWGSRNGHATQLSRA